MKKPEELQTEAEVRKSVHDIESLRKQGIAKEDAWVHKHLDRTAFQHFLPVSESRPLWADHAMPWRIPEPLKAEHDELHATLSAAIQAPGRVGEAAQAVAQLLHPHLLKEEAYALPPLGALLALARSEPIPEAAEVIAIADQLQTELPAMVQEHQAIIAALDDFVSAAKDANRPEYVQFAGKAVLHTRIEEEVLYPAAILVGRYLARKADPTG